MKKYWRIWAKALGNKEGYNNREADKVAIIRTIIVAINLLCAILISINIIIGWL